MIYGFDKATVYFHFRYYSEPEQEVTQYNLYFFCFENKCIAFFPILIIQSFPTRP